MKRILFGVLMAVAIFCTRWFRGNGVGEADEYKVGGTD
jgi:hypothetical protein